MSMDDRDKANIDFDVNGDCSYTTKDGHIIRNINPNDGDKYKELEDEMNLHNQFPMGMK